MIPRIFAFTPDVVGAACIFLMLAIVIVLSYQALKGN